VADERGLDEALFGGLDCAFERNLRERPADGGGDGGQRLAAGEEFVEDVEVGSVVDEGIDGDGFSEWGEIAPEGILRGLRKEGFRGLTRLFSREGA
jgi:hypothetical protein